MNNKNFNKIKFAKLSEVGGREQNEDFAEFLQVGNYSCFVVCDGLGGHENGEIASRFVVKYLISRFSKEPTVEVDVIEKYIVDANTVLLQGVESNLKTTLAMVIFDGESWVFAHVGDTRIYYMDSSSILYQSRDHSVPFMLYKLGEITEAEIRGHEDSNKLLKTMGYEWDKPKCEIYKIPHVPTINTAVLICSDGFWQYVTESEILKLYRRSFSPKNWLKKIQKIILKRADFNSMDNYTAISIMTKKMRRTIK